VAGLLLGALLVGLLHGRISTDGSVGLLVQSFKAVALDSILYIGANCFLYWSGSLEERDFM
jgi:hypothetical protein